MDFLPVYSMWKEPLTMCQVDGLRRYNNAIICSCSLVPNQNSERKDCIVALRYFLAVIWEGIHVGMWYRRCRKCKKLFYLSKAERKRPQYESVTAHTSRPCRMVGQGSMMYGLPVAKNGSLRTVSYDLKNNESIVSNKDKIYLLWCVLFFRVTCVLFSGILLAKIKKEIKFFIIVCLLLK